MGACASFSGVKFVGEKPTCRLRGNMKLPPSMGATSYIGKRLSVSTNPEIPRENPKLPAEEDERSTDDGKEPDSDEHVDGAI